MIAQTVGRFTLIRKLPAGGMGRVFEADDPVTARRMFAIVNSSATIARQPDVPNLICVLIKTQAEPYLVAFRTTLVSIKAPRQQNTPRGGVALVNFCRSFLRDRRQ